MDKSFEPYLEEIEKAINKYLPSMPENDWKTDSFGLQEQCVSREHFSPLLDPTVNLISLGGKRWRPLLLVLTAEAASKGKKSVLKSAYNLTPLVEYVHTASLIHDDIEDNSDTRRGKPAAYISYGTDVAVNAGAWLFFEASVCIDSAKLKDSTKLKLYQLYSQKTRCVHLGQAMDISWHKNKRYLPTEEEYFAMVQNKTGTLSSLATHIGAITANLSGSKCMALDHAANRLGVGFQIIDDVINLTTGNPGKKRGDDIVEGKKSLPVLKFAAKAQKSQLEELFTCFERAAIDGIESEAVEHAVNLIESSGAIREAYAQGTSIIQSNLETFSKVLGNNQQTELIKKLFINMIPPNPFKEVQNETAKE